MQTTQSPKAGERTQHTPGPWKLEDESSTGPRGDASIHYDIPSVGSIYLGDVNIKRDPELLETMQANARLIAAAPELLEALKELVEAIWDGRLESEGAETFTDPARAAIAKAERTNL